MTVAKLNTANDLRKPDNAQQHIFRKVAGIVGLPEESAFVLKTVPIGLISPVVGAASVRVPRKPLRLVVARTPVPYQLSSGWSGTYFLDTLSCGHQVTTYSGEESKKKRGCQECLDAQIAAKKPVQSIGKKVA